MRKMLFIIFIFHLSTFGIFAQWNIIPTGVGANFRSVFFVNSITGYIAGDSLSYSMIIKTTNGGISWLRQNTGLYNNYHNCIYFVDENTGYVVNGYNGYDGKIYKTTDGGTSWIQKYSNAYYGIESVFFIDVLTGFAAGSSQNMVSLILKTTNSGNSWSTIFPGLSTKLHSIFFTDSITGFATGLGVILRTTDAAVNWNPVLQTSFVDFYTVYFPTSSIGYAGGRDMEGGAYYMYKTTNTGGNWLHLIPVIPSPIRSIYFTDINTGYAVGDTGRISRTTNGGITWYLQTSGSILSLNSVYFTDANTGYICGGSYTSVVLKTTNGGVTALEPASNQIPNKFELFQNYPNPFNPVTYIRFDIPLLPARRSDNAGGRGVDAEGRRGVLLVIYDILGREVATLVNEQLQPGTYEVEWDASNFASGVYYYKIIAGDYTETRKMVLIK